MRLLSVDFTYTIPRECRSASLVMPNGKGSSRGKAFAMIRPIMRNELVLQQPSTAATEADLPIAQDLLDTLAAHRHSCVGMAANMIGEVKRIIAFDNEGAYLAMLNPEIVSRAGAYETEEGCLSLAGTRPTTRYRTIKVSYQDLAMKPRVKTFTGFTAQIIQHEIEEAALKKEDDTLSQEHLSEIRKELAELRDEFNAKKAQWENEKNAIGKVQKLREELEAANAALEKAQREYDLNRAAELQYGRIPELKKQLEAEEAIANEGRARSLLRDKVTEEEIARIIERWTGIPVAKLMEGEREKLLHLEDILHRRVVGQDEAVRLVSEAILRSRAGIADPDRPIGSFLFLGPTGVGKTELAKALAEALFDSEKNLVRIDMSEYMEKFSVSRLIGAPPGYVGYEEGGQLTEAVRRHPYSVVLFDEVEKAHPDVFNVLLQVLDDGRITDSQGRTVDFKNTIIILTSNLGSQYLLDGIDAGGEITEAARKAVTELLHHSFRPEFLNRLDEIVFYKPLTKENITRIIDLLTAELNGRLAEKQLTVTLTDSARRFIIDSAYDPAFGARPLRRFVQHTVETLISRRIIADEAAPGETLTVDCVDGQLTVSSHTVLRGEVVDA